MLLIRWHHMYTLVLHQSYSSTWHLIDLCLELVPLYLGLITLCDGLNLFFIFWSLAQCLYLSLICVPSFNGQISLYSWMIQTIAMVVIAKLEKLALLQKLKIMTFDSLMLFKRVIIYIIIWDSMVLIRRVIF